MSDHLSTPHTIRAAEKADMDGLVLLIDMLNISEGSQRRCDRASLLKAFFDKNDKLQMHLDVVVAEHALIAFAFYYWGYDLASESYGLHLADFAVHKDFRRNQVGTKLLEHIMRVCLQAGGSWVSLTSSRTNRVAKQFYASCGMQQVDVDFYAVGPKGMRALHERLYPSDGKVVPAPSERI